MSECGYCFVVIGEGCDPLDPRVIEDISRTAERAGAVLTGQVDVVRPEQFEEKQIPEPVRVGLPVARWTMTRSTANV